MYDQGSAPRVLSPVIASISSSPNLAKARLLDAPCDRERLEDQRAIADYDYESKEFLGTAPGATLDNDRRTAGQGKSAEAFPAAYT